MQCNSCEKTIAANSKFCEHCGKKVDKKDREQHKATSDIIDHLEFLGFSIEKSTSDDNNDKFVATHANRSNLIVTVNSDVGISVYSMYTLDEKKSKKDRSKLLEEINKCNLQSLICSYSTSEDGSIFYCSAWYPPDYSKTTFSKFIEMYEYDIQKRLQNTEINKYS